MKKLLLILMAAFLVAGVNAQVDLQVQRAYRYVSYVFSPAEQLFITVQNNGPDDFEGQLEISVSDGNGGKIIFFSGTIPSLETREINVLGSPRDIAYSIYLDPNEKIQERNENNNYLYYKASEPQVRIMSGGLIAEHAFDTLYVTPGEFYDAQFVIADMNDHNSIIGVDFDMTTYDSSEQFGFSTAFTYINDIMDGYSCSVKESNQLNIKRMNIKLLANSSEHASSRFWVGYFWGYGENQIGKVSNVHIFSKFALLNLQNGNDYANRTIKVRDAVRCDINGDSVVNREDFEILKMVVDDNNSWLNKKNRYTRKGVNYGAGRIIFSQPDFLSVALLNIWLNNPNDPLVQGLGIGELMSKNMPGSEASAVKPIDNTFAVSENGEVTIDAPEADVYNIVAQDANGKMIQRTGRLGEEIILPADTKNIRVETVKIKNGTTGLFNASVGPKISVFPNPVTDYVNISSPEKGKMSVISLSGQEIYSSAINAQESLTLSTGDWEKGVYLIKIATENGQSTVKVVK